MGFCPVCRFEYEPGVNVCPDCNEALVSHLPEQVSKAAVTPDDSWIGVCRIAGMISSGLVKGALDSNNIPSMIMSSAFGTFGSRSGLGGQAASGAQAAGGDVLMVPREFRQEAEIILEAVLGDDFHPLQA